MGDMTTLPLDAFAYQETATGGGHRRNRPMRSDEFHPSSNAVDVFATYLRYTDDVVGYVATNRNPKGKPSITGYAGPALAPFLPVDFDDAEDLTAALTDARTYVQRFCARFDVPPAALRCFFSGFKGFSLEVPGSLFGGLGPAPARDLADRLKVLALVLAEGLTTLDAKIYEPVRLWRVPNTINGKSGLHKIPLTTHELLSLDLAEIRQLASAARDVDTIPDDEWEPHTDLVALWQEAATQTPIRRSVTSSTAARRLTDRQLAAIIAAVTPSWTLGQKHDLALCLAGFLASSGIGEDQTVAIVEHLAANDQRPDDRVNGALSTYHRLSAGLPILGHFGLRKLLPTPDLRAVERSVAAAEATITAGGRDYRCPADDVVQPNDPNDDDESATDELGGDTPPEDPASEADPGDEADLLLSLRKRAGDEPGGFVRKTLEQPDAIGALARAARQDRSAYEAFLLALREDGVKAGEIKRLERAINDAIQRGRPKFRVVGPDEEAVGRRVKEALPTAPVTDMATVPLGYQLTPSGVVEEHVSDDGDTRRIAVASTPIVVNGRLVDVNTDEESMRVAWQRDGRWREQTIGRAVVANARDLVGLASIGFPVNSRTSGDLVGYVAAYEAANIRHLPRARVSNQMGWQGSGGSLGFLVGRTLIRPGGDDEGAIDLDQVAPENWQEDWVAFHGADTGDAQIADGFGPAGSVDDWIRAAHAASAYPRVAVAIYASLATPLLDVLGAPNFVIDWSFATSTGKTTTLRAAGSCWGNPSEQAAASVVGTWDATRVYIERASAVLNGLPLILDDTKRARNPKAVAQTIYDVVSGRGRGRGSPRGMRRSGTWATILLSTGEAPATSFTEDGGTRARVLTLWGPPFGRADATTAPVVQQIDLGVRHSYGHAGPQLVRYIADHRDQWDRWRDRYRQIQQEYLERAGGNPVAGRLAAYFALLDVTAKLAHHVLDLPWAYEGPVDALWDDLVHEASDADRASAALAMVASWAQANQHTFEGRLDVDQHYNDKTPTLGLSGKWDRAEDWESIAFFSHKIKDLLEKGGFDPEATIRTWRDREWLETHGDRKRYTRNIRIRGEKTWAVVIKRSAVETPMEGGA
ncbi:MAG: DUF927 domain-containing protein [Chloroflexota bacterium]|nr:DUF927 domain-containing protein [Chloroflexota bacterium]